MPSLLLTLALLLRAAHCIVEFDNHITDEPTISCDAGSMFLKVNTEKSVPSHVFVKGHFRKDGCSFSNTANATFEFAKCDVQRQREVNPRGMAYTMTVVVQLHPLFTTRVDRAFRLRCFYKEAEKSVGAEVSVSDPTPVQLSDDAEQPVCSYTIHKESPNGPIAKFAVLGDVLYHVWECPSEVYQMAVYDCDVFGGSDYSKKVIGQNGCSDDVYIMPNLIYNENKTKAFVNSNAFNFPDQAGLKINCRIRICANVNGNNCNHPKCDGSAASIDEPFEPIGNELARDELITTPMPTDAPTTTTTTTTTTPSTTTTSTTTTTEPPTTTITRVLDPTTTVTLPTDFPTPDPMFRLLKAPKKNVTEVDEEGSGLEILEPLAQRLTSSEEPRTTKREIKRRDAMDVDVSSDITILDGALAADLPSPQEQQSPLAHDGSLKAVCLPYSVLWLLLGIILFAVSITFGALCYTAKKSPRFHVLP